MGAGGRVLVAVFLAAAAVSMVDTGSAGAGSGARMVDDPTSNGRITARTHTVLRAVQGRGLDGDGVRCHAQRPANPDSDHPTGKACDVMFNPHQAATVAEGWRLARWLIRHHEYYRITYLIWQGQYWSAEDPGWVPYTSPAYGCPNPANLTGCHYDHLHFSVA